MAEKNTQTLDNLNQNNLGDKKLSREEIAYIQSKDQLWFKDIGEKLFDDIVSTNEKLLKDNTALKAFIDDIILQPETLRQIAQKAGISLGKVEKMFSEGNQNLDNKTSKYYVVINLLLYGCTKNIFPEVRGNLIDNINKPAFTGATAKALHKFQKMGEQTQGRSKADCLLGPKTLQQMLSYLGVQTVNQKVDSETFARSNMSAKETYEWNAQQQKQMDIIINDPALTPEQKVSFLVQVANKTVDVGSDKLNKKYGAVSYMCQLIANNLMVGTTPEQQENILAAVLPYEKLIKKYWNEKSAVEYGVDPKLVPKTNDFVKDIKDMAKAVEAKYQSNTIMTQTALQICGAWISYYQQDNPTGRKKHQTSIEQGKKELESLLTHKTTGDIRQNIVSAMDKIFFDTAQNFDFSTVVTDTVIVGGVDIAGSFTSFENLQKRAFKGVKNIFLADKKRTEKESKNAINEVLTAFRYIDKEMDGDFDIGIGEKFRMGSWKTSEGIRSTVENMGMSGLALDIKNAPQEFTNEQNVIKNGVQNIKNALETDPNGSVAQKVDKLLAAIVSNDTTTVKALIKDAELFGMDVSDKSINEIIKRMQDISKQNEKNKNAVMNDVKKNYDKVYEQMKGTQLWLREQGRSEEADILEGNKQVFETLINGGVVTNPPAGLEQFVGKTLDTIATEEIHKMERMQLTGVLEVGLMRGLMMKYEDMLKTLAEKTGLSADENLLKLYADIDGFDGSWKDETCNIVGSIAAEILITIVVCVLTAGVGGIVVNSVLKGAQGVFKAVRWGKAANTIARFGQLGNTSLKVIRTATGVSKTVKTTQTAAKVLYRTTALLAEAPAFNTVSKMIHNGIEGNSLLSGIDLNPLAKENIQTAAFLGVMHGFSVLKSGAVSINFGKAGEVFAKSPQFVKSASSVAGEFTTMMASEQVMNLTFGREIPDPNDPTKTIIERGIHIPEKKDVIQMVGMILGMRASAKYNLWPKIEARLKTGEFTIIGKTSTDLMVVDKKGNKMSIIDVASGKYETLFSKKSTKSTNEKKNASQEQPLSKEEILSKISDWVKEFGRGRTEAEFMQILANLSSKSARVRTLAEAELSQIDPNQIRIITELYEALKESKSSSDISHESSNVPTENVQKVIKELDAPISKFDLSRGASKSKRKIEKTSVTEEVPGLGTYEYSKRNNWVRLTLKTPFGTMEAEARDLTSNEFILHADIGNNRLVAGKAYKYIFDKLPEGAKIMEKNNLSGDSYTNLLKLYKKGNTSEYNIYASGYVELNLQGKNSALSKVIAENRIQEDGTVSAYFKTEQAAQIVLQEIFASTKGLGLPEPRIVAKQDGTFVIEIPNIIIEKTHSTLSKSHERKENETKPVVENIPQELMIEYSETLNSVSQANEGSNHISVLNKVMALLQKGVALPKQLYVSLKISFDAYVLKYISAINKAIATENSKISLRDIQSMVDSYIAEAKSIQQQEKSAKQREKNINTINRMKNRKTKSKNTNVVEDNINIPKIEIYKNQYKEREKKAKQAINNIKSINAKIIEVENSSVSQNIIETKKTKLLGLIEKEVNIIFSADPTIIVGDIRSELLKKDIKGQELDNELGVYNIINSNFYRECKDILTQSKKTEEIHSLGKYISDRFKHRDRHTLETSQGTIQFENIGKNIWILHASLSSKILAGKAYNFLFDKLPIGAKIIEQKSLSGDSFTNLLKLYKKGGDVDCAVSYDGYVSLNNEGKFTGISGLVNEYISKQTVMQSRNGNFVVPKDIAQEIVDNINNNLIGTDLPKCYIEQVGSTGEYLVKIPNIVLTKLEGNLPGFMREIGSIKTLEDTYQFLEKIALEKIKFSDIKLTGQQLKDRITQYQAGKLDISYIPKELRDKITSLPVPVVQKKTETN